MGKKIPLIERGTNTITIAYQLERNWKMAGGKINIQMDIQTYHVAEGRKSCSTNGEAEGAACQPAGTISSYSLIQGSDYDPICILDVRPQIQLDGIPFFPCGYVVNDEQVPLVLKDSIQGPNQLCVAHGLYILQHIDYGLALQNLFFKRKQEGVIPY